VVNYAVVKVGLSHPFEVPHIVAMQVKLFSAINGQQSFIFIFNLYIYIYIYIYMYIYTCTQAHTRTCKIIHFILKVILMVLHEILVYALFFLHFFVFFFSRLIGIE
jgi:hypothetical protein